MIRFTIEGIPKPKGNSRQFWKIHGRRTPIIAPSAAFLAWQSGAKWQIALLRLGAPLTVPVRVEAVFYRDARADIDNLCKALGDVLQHCGVLKNDRQIVQWSARREKPEGRPRVEVVIEEVE